MSYSPKKAVILVSGGLDSATVLAIATQQNFECYALSFDYGQRHATELMAAKRICERHGVKEHKILNLDLQQLGGSALTDHSIDVIGNNSEDEIPITYVPARNTVFLSIALGYAETIAADSIFIGANAIDYSGYPDCRPEYIKAFQAMANLATKYTVEGQQLTIATPIIDMTKAEIIQVGTELGVDYGQTISCYQADEEGRACGECDSCKFRKQGFLEAGIADPTNYF